MVHFRTYKNVDRVTLTYDLSLNNHENIAVCGHLCFLKVNIGDTVKSRYLEVDGTIFYKFKLPEVQINLHFG